MLGHSCIVRNAVGEVVVSGTLNRIVEPKGRVIVTGSGNMILQPQGLVTLFGVRNLVVQADVPAPVTNPGGETNQVMSYREASQGGQQMFITVPEALESDPLGAWARQRGYAWNQLSVAADQLYDAAESLQTAREIMSFAGFPGMAAPLHVLEEQTFRYFEFVHSWAHRNTTLLGGNKRIRSEARMAGEFCLWDHPTDAGDDTKVEQCGLDSTESDTDFDDYDMSIDTEATDEESEAVGIMGVAPPQGPKGKERLGNTDPRQAMAGERATIVTSRGWGNEFPSQGTWTNTGTRSLLTAVQEGESREAKRKIPLPHQRRRDPK